MRKTLFVLLWLLEMSCSTARHFTPIENCRFPPGTPLTCTSGVLSVTSIPDPSKYLCFKVEDLTVHEQECRQ